MKNKVLWQMGAVIGGAFLVGIYAATLLTNLWLGVALASLLTFLGADWPETYRKLRVTVRDFKSGLMDEFRVSGVEISTETRAKRCGRVAAALLFVALIAPPFYLNYAFLDALVGNNMQLVIRYFASGEHTKFGQELVSFFLTLCANILVPSGIIIITMLPVSWIILKLENKPMITLPLLRFVFPSLGCVCAKIVPASFLSDSATPNTPGEEQNASIRTRLKRCLPCIITLICWPTLLLVGAILGILLAIVFLLDAICTGILHLATAKNTTATYCVAAGVVMDRLFFGNEPHLLRLVAEAVFCGIIGVGIYSLREKLLAIEVPPLAVEPRATQPV